MEIIYYLSDVGQGRFIEIIYYLSDVGQVRSIALIYYLSDVDYPENGNVYNKIELLLNMTKCYRLLREVNKLPATYIYLQQL